MESKQEITILIVDDTPINLKLLQISLQREGYSVISASNGLDARQLVATHLPDLVLMDIIMPKESGFEVLEKMQRNPKTNSIPVIFLTGNDDVSSKVKGFELGAVDYIVKPFNTTEVIARVRLHLKLSLATKALVQRQTEKLKQIHDAQAAMLVNPSDLPQAKFGIYYSSLFEAGGDFYDVLQVAENISVYMVADVSGHDIGTSFITAAVKALLQQNSSLIYSPSDSMKMMNSVLIDILPEAKYLTAVFARLNRQTLMMSLVNAGHPPVVYVPVNKPAEFISARGTPVGILSDAYFETCEMKVAPGDRFYIYSDGLLERAQSRQVWTALTKELLPFVEEMRNIPIHDAATKLNEMVCYYKSEPDDDIVIMAIEV
ncbi:MAG: fused response regulator/phosphatase [Deltaproteobacteria bacterium]|nr:fused response regulator/phosphatase [Deltaproteobacteria bacterium]